MEPTLKFSPTELISAITQTLDYAYSSVVLVGEVASFKVNQGKWVFFDVKDEESSVNCFMSVYQLRMPLEDGMKVVCGGIITEINKVFTKQGNREMAIVKIEDLTGEFNALNLNFGASRLNGVNSMISFFKNL